jgi:hypothetical protein
LRGHDETIAQRLERDLVAFQRPLPPTRRSRHESLSLVRYRLNDCSVPTTYDHRDVLVRGYVHQAVIGPHAWDRGLREPKSASQSRIAIAKAQSSSLSSANRSSMSR